MNDRAQLYTIEGISAAILMITTAYLVITTTTVFTPQDVHISHMQLQQLGNDALNIMDTPDTYGTPEHRSKSPLEQYIEQYQTNDFDARFLSYINSPQIIGESHLNYNASVYYRNNTGINSFYLGGNIYYRENAVKVYRWVYLSDVSILQSYNSDIRNEVPQTVLLEVLIWRT